MGMTVAMIVGALVLAAAVGVGAGYLAVAAVDRAAQKLFRHGWGDW